MNPDAMEPFALALLDYFRGNESAAFVVRRDDGLNTTLPAGHFFRAPDEFSAIENAAIGLCKGRVAINHLRTVSSRDISHRSLAAISATTAPKTSTGIRDHTRATRGASRLTLR